MKLGGAKKPKSNIFLKESFLIEKNIVLDGELDTLRIACALIPNQDEIMVSVVYDELLQKPIKNIAWQIEDSHSKKKIVSATKNQQNILQQMEEMAQALDPNSAYDRIIHNKHLIKKDFYFKKSEIFDLSKPLVEQKQFLELSFIKNEKPINYQLDISSEIYYKQLVISKKPEKPKTQSQRPVQVQQKTQAPSPNFGNAKVPSYLFPGRDSKQTETPAEQKPDPSQILELKELEEANMRLKGVDEFYMNTMQNPSSEVPDANNLKMLMESEGAGIENSEELF